MSRRLNIFTSDGSGDVDEHDVVYPDIVSPSFPNLPRSQLSD